MQQISRFIALATASAWLGAAPVMGGEPGDPPKGDSPKAATSARSATSAKASAGAWAAAVAEATRPSADPLAAAVIDDATLSSARGGDSHLSQNNSTGTVTGNVASQLTTGNNTVSEGSFANSSGIPIVIQNSGNNVLIQNSTILNLQLQPTTK